MSARKASRPSTAVFTLENVSSLKRTSRPSTATLNGYIKLRDSVVEGDIIFRETQQYGKHSQPKLVIDTNSEVRGRIILRQKVTLKIEDGARVGEIVEEF
jgi:hypothetical protein